MSCRFSLTPRLREAVERARVLAKEGSDEALAFAAAAREGTIALSDVVAASRLLREKANASASSSPAWVHELLLNASPVLPVAAKRAPAHPELAPRLAKLRAAQEDRDYARMVGAAARDDDSANRDAAEMSTYRSQMGVGLNLLVSMATMFTVGAYAGGTEEEPFGVRAVVCGLVLMVLAMAVEMSLFLIGAMRVDAKVHQRETKAKARGTMDRTRLKQVATPTEQPVAASSSSGGLRSVGHSVHVE